MNSNLSLDSNQISIDRLNIFCDNLVKSMAKTGRSKGSIWVDGESHGMRLISFLLNDDCKSALVDDSYTSGLHFRITKGEFTDAGISITVYPVGRDELTKILILN